MIEVRELRNDDSVEAITSLLHAAYAPLAAMNFRYTASYQDRIVIERRLRRGYPFVAVEAGEIVGTITLYGPCADSPCEWYRQARVFCFGQFAVSPCLQRQGLGTRLLGTVERLAREHGACELALDTAEGATGLREWYERRSFRSVTDRRRSMPSLTQPTGLKVFSKTHNKAFSPENRASFRENGGLPG